MMTEKILEELNYGVGNKIWFMVEGLLGFVHVFLQNGWIRHRKVRTKAYLQLYEAWYSNQICEDLLVWLPLHSAAQLKMPK